MQLVQKFRNILPTMVTEELDHLMASIGAFFHVEHKEDGTHANIHADTITAGTITTGTITTTSGGTTSIKGDIEVDAAGHAYIDGALVWRDKSQPENSRLVASYLRNDRLAIQAYSDDYATAQRNLLDINRTTGAVITSGPITERSRTTPMGEWISVPYAALNFAGGGSMTWTVEAADVTTNLYTLIGKTCIYTFDFATTTIGGTVSTSLRAGLPSAATAAAQIVSPIWVQNPTNTIGYAVTSAGSTLVQFFKDVTLATAWTLGTNNVRIVGTITFPIL